MSEFHNDSTAASDPGKLTLSEQKLRWLQPELFGIRGLFVRYPCNKGKSLNGSGFLKMLKEHMQCGDSRAAVVARLDPLIVAAYTDELDCVALLEFPSWLVEDYSLKVGSRLLSVNTYGRRPKFAADLVEGPNSYGNWNHFFPVIAEFTCDGMDQIDRRKRQIPDAEWKRAAQMGKLKLSQSANTPRDGRPLRSAKPA
jgi:hypothetical protein